MCKYTAKKAQEIADWVAENGLSEYGGARVADLIAAHGISEPTFFRWMKENESFKSLIEKAKETFRKNAAQELYDSLYHKAKGYNKKLTKTKTIKEGKKTKVETIVEEHHYAPDTAAAIFLLTNLDGEKYKNKQETNTKLSAPQGTRIVVENAADAKMLADVTKQADEI